MFFSTFSSSLLLCLASVCIQCLLLTAEGVGDEEANHLPTFSSEEQLMDTIENMDINNVLVLSCMYVCDVCSCSRSV